MLEALLSDLSLALVGELVGLVADVVTGALGAVANRHVRALNDFLVGLSGAVVGLLARLAGDVVARGGQLAVGLLATEPFDDAAIRALAAELETLGGYLERKKSKTRKQLLPKRTPPRARLHLKLVDPSRELRRVLRTRRCLRRQPPLFVLK